MDVSLGFVDLQVNGYGGVSFSDPALTHEAAAEACEAVLARGGTCALLPTLITAPREVYARNLPLLARLIESPRFAGRLLGIHIEGPFLSPFHGAIGCHPREHVLVPAALPGGGCDLLDEWQQLARGHIRLLTLAAEVEGAAALCAHAVRRRRIAVALGHQLARREQIGELAAAGATLLTHLGNGCPNTLHRHDNHLWPSLADDRLSAMVIADGQHLPADALVAMVRAKGVARLILTSDVSPAAGLPDGEHDCFGSVVHVEGRHVRSADRSCLAGSGALMLDCVNHLASLRFRPTDPDAEPPPIFGCGEAPEQQQQQAAAAEGEGDATAVVVGRGGRGLSVAELVRVGFDNPLRAIGCDPSEVRRRLADAALGADAVPVPRIEWGPWLLGTSGRRFVLVEQ